MSRPEEYLALHQTLTSPADISAARDLGQAMIRRFNPDRISTHQDAVTFLSRGLWVIHTLLQAYGDYDVEPLGNDVHVAVRKLGRFHTESYFATSPRLIVPIPGMNLRVLPPFVRLTDGRAALSIDIGLTGGKRVIPGAGAISTESGEIITHEADEEFSQPQETTTTFHGLLKGFDRALPNQ